MMTRTDDSATSLRDALTDAVLDQVRVASWDETMTLGQIDEQIRQVLVAALLPLVTPTWQPMETCPDGATVLTKMKHGVIEGTWNQAEGVCEGYYFMNITWFPEAWMPLPPAPKERQG